ncbi:MAG: ferrous iron transporter B, partial [Nitrospinota bacterium]
QSWSGLQALCFLLFYLLYFPCGTTLLTIWRETRSVRWTAVAFFLPLAVAALASATVYQVGSLLFS